MAHTTIRLYDLQKQGWDFGLKDYPIFDESHRNELNSKLINEYLFEEIGQETPDMFNFYLNRAMAKIMPYYNELYKTAAVQLDVLKQYDYTEDYSESGGEDRTYNETTSNNIQGTADTEDHASSTAEGENTGLISRPPQGKITKNDLSTGVYAREGTYTLDNSNTSTEDTNTTTTNTQNDGNRESKDHGTRFHYGNRRKSGRDKPIAELIAEARNVILNIDRMIIEDNEIYSLFYNNYF